ncbi:MAG: ABC transporter ATP-binding protein [Muribaculaceae bacterium]|nr:ABC transporter ATP-binding protein [Muribaculaceae bacterium]
MTTENLTVGYGARVVLSNLDLRLESGRVTVLIGANGSGKSTLLRTLTGHQPALSGNVLLDGTPITSLKPAELARRLSLVLTDRTGGGGLRVKELVAVGRHPYSGFMGRLSETDRQAVEHALEAVGLSHKSDDFVSSLSDGERQKAMIARAVAQDTAVMVLDEPTSFLDVSARFEIMELLSRIASAGKSVLLSTHDIASALAVTDTVWAVPYKGTEVRAVKASDPDFSSVMDSVYPSARFDIEISDYRPLKDFGFHEKNS